ncbi:hypothetical protein ACFSR9_13095 [Deinococcus taklimakanensis]|uniref:Uncharacterized protein n=1 Tax=Deinococcus taklimakanensis TaxID=536443 RepID=A0ABW5P519_9DEIO
MEKELIFEIRDQHPVVRADSLHAALSVTTDLRLWVVMHTAAGNAQAGIDVFDMASPLTAFWSLPFAAEVAWLEREPNLASVLAERTDHLSA